MMKLFTFSRRQFLLTLSSISGFALSFGTRRAAANADYIEPSNIEPYNTGVLQELKGNAYPVLGYKRLILDYHFSEFNPDALKNANAKEIVDAMVDLGVDSLLLYSKDHWGNVYHKSTFSKRHKNVPQDLFGEVLAGLKQQGIRVIAYTTFSWDEYIARKHPEWLRVDVDGKPIRHNLGQNLYAKWNWICLNSPYRDFFLRQMDELIGNYDFEGLFLDIVFHRRAQVCYSPYCQQRWKEKYGGEIPRDLQGSDYARYLDFRRENFEELFQQVREVGRKHNKRFMLTHNYGLTYRHDDYVATEFDPHGVDFYNPTLSAKLYRARAGGKEVELIGHRFNQHWDFMIKPVELMRFEVATGIAHNCAVMYVDQPYIDGGLDKRVYQTLKKGFQAADELVPLVKGTVPYAEIGVLTSERSFDMDPATYRDFAGAYEMLTELHWPFDVLTEENLNQRDLAKYRVLIVPNIVYMSTAQVAEVRRYVEQGGSLLFCYRSATFDENAKQSLQLSFGLVQITGETDNQVSFIKPKWEVSSPFLRVTPVALVKAASGLTVAGTMLNPALRITDTEWISHNIMPGEETTNPTILQGKLGKGTFVYYGFRIFEEYVSQAVPAMHEVFVKGMQQLYQPQVWVEAPRVVEAVFNRHGDELRIVLINGITGKSIQGDKSWGEKGVRGHITMNEVIPIHEITVKVRGPAINEAYSLRRSKLKVERSGDVTSMTVPVLNQYDGVRFRMR